MTAHAKGLWSNAPSNCTCEFHFTLNCAPFGWYCCYESHYWLYKNSFLSLEQTQVYIASSSSIHYMASRATISLNLLHLHYNYSEINRLQIWWEEWGCLQVTSIMKESTEINIVKWKQPGSFLRIKKCLTISILNIYHLIS